MRCIGLMPEVPNSSQTSVNAKTQAIIFVVDDEPAVRHSLQSLLTSDGWRVQIYADGRSFLKAIATDQLGCVVLDMKLPDMDGLAIYEEMQKRELSLPVLFYSGLGTVRTATAAMKRGAVDFIEKDDGPQHLLDAISKAVDRHCALRARHTQSRQIRHMLDSLTPRENEVLALVMEGKTSREIANQLHRSEKTIQLHRANIMKKFNVRRVVDLINMVTAAQEE
jgi:FixJ family two-component response regulator